MNKLYKVLVGFLFLVFFILGGYFLLRESSNPINDDNENSDLAYLDQGDWEEFYILDHLDLDKELYFYKTLEYDGGVSVSYKTSIIAPVIDNVMLLDNKLMFEGWIKNPQTQEWTLITFHVMGKYSKEDLQLLESSVPLEISTKNHTYYENEVFMSQTLDIDAMMKELSDALHEQISIEFYYDIDLQNYLDIYEIDSDPIIVDLLLSDNYNKLNITDITSPQILDNSEIYVTSIELLNHHHK
jgi:hypothetical protein